MRPVTVLFDMDGVLADFTGGALARHGASLDPKTITWDFPAQIGFAGSMDPAFWSPLENLEFWANLEPLHDGMAVFRAVEEVVGVSRIGLLSSGLCPGSCDGKRAWIERHLPAYTKRVAFLTAKDLVAAPCKLLVDDYESNTDGFERAGGKSVLVPRNWNRRRSATCPDGWFDPGALASEIIREIG